MQLITNILNLLSTLNHYKPSHHAVQPTIHYSLLYLAKHWDSKANENNTAHHDFIHKYSMYNTGKK